MRTKNLKKLNPEQLERAIISIARGIRHGVNQSQFWLEELKHTNPDLHKNLLMVAKTVPSVQMFKIEFTCPCVCHRSTLHHEDVKCPCQR